MKMLYLQNVLDEPVEVPEAHTKSKGLRPAGHARA